jgi:hypothetical protein
MAERTRIRGGALLAALTLLCAAPTSAQTPVSFADVEAEVRAAREEAEAARELERRLRADMDRLSAALDDAKARAQEATTRAEAQRRVLEQWKARRIKAEARIAAAEKIRSAIHAAILAVKRTLESLRKAEGVETPTAAEAAIGATDAPLSRRVAAAFLALERGRPADRAIVVRRVLKDGAPGRTLVVGRLASYFVPDDPSARVYFLKSGASAPEPFVAAVRAAADAVEKKTGSTVLKLPLEP